MVANLFSRLLGLFSADTLIDAEPIDAQTSLASLTAEFNANVGLLADGLVSGDISYGEWDAAMRSEIRSQQLGAAVVGVGGAHVANASTYQLAQQQTDAQMVYFDAFSAQVAQQLEDGTLPSAAALSARARQYGSAAGATFSQAAVSAQGVPALPFYPRDGSTECRVFCCCEWRILPLRGVDNYECFWILDPACDHCPQCAARRAVCNPLRIRNGVIVDAATYQAANLYRV